VLDTLVWFTLPGLNPTHSSPVKGSHVIYTLQKTRRYKVISVDNYHNSLPAALDRVSQLSQTELPGNATPLERESTEIDAYNADLTKPEQVRAVFEKYGKGGIWGVIHIAVCPPSKLAREIS
jgi:UDP-glucose 4-epimerase